jgi:hypothetical protein
MMLIKKCVKDGCLSVKTLGLIYESLTAVP